MLAQCAPRLLRAYLCTLGRGRGELCVSTVNSYFIMGVLHESLKFKRKVYMQ